MHSSRLRQPQRRPSSSKVPHTISPVNEGIHFGKFFAGEGLPAF